MMDNIDDDATSRIEVELDLFDEQAYEIGNLQEEISKRFGKNFNPRQKRAFAEKIRDKHESGWRSDKEVLDKYTSLSGAGFGSKRHPMVRDSDTGQYIGSRMNIVITSRSGSRVYIQNTKTGKTGIIKNK